VSPTYRLYHYWRSSSSWRVRFALDFKGISYEPVAVSLLSGESESAEHLARNPAGAVPVLEIPGNPPIHLTESLAILLFLEETHPDRPSLLRGDAISRARILALAELINSGIQPFHNPPVLGRHSSEPEEQKAWARDFIERGFGIYEALCQKTRGEFSVGDEPSLADACLIPQIYSAERFGVTLDGFPAIQGIHKNLKALPAFASSHADAFKPIDFKG
jgi:maleylpyruvate isomerase